MKTVEEIFSTIELGTRVIVRDWNCNICFDGEVDTEGKWEKKLGKYQVASQEEENGYLELHLDQLVPLRLVAPEFRGDI